MAGKTDTTKLQFLFKKALGVANTSNLKTDAEETAGSVWQLAASSIFAQQVPNSPTTNDSDLNTVQGGAVEYTILTASTVPGSTYNANDSGGGGSEGSQSSGPHCYSFSLNTAYQANSSNPKKGTGSFTNGLALSASNGAVQIVSTAFSTQSPNPYLLKLYEDNGSGGLGSQIFPTAEVDWYLDAYNGVLFIQDYEAATIPKFAKAFIYTGDFVSNFTGDAMAVSGSAGGKTSKVLLMSGSGNDSNTIHSVSDVAYAGDPANYVDTTFYVSGAVGAVSDNKAGVAVVGGDAYISGALYLAELRSGVIPANPPDGRIAIYGKDDSGVTKIYFRNESGESEIGSGGGSAGGSNTQVQFNNAGSLSGISGLTSDGTNATFGDTSLLVGRDIIHSGDADTFFRFTSDAISVQAGGAEFITVTEDDTQDKIVINSAAADIDFSVEGSSRNNLFKVDASRNQVLILSGGAGQVGLETSYSDVSFFVSGSVGAKSGSIYTGTVEAGRGISLFGGDVVVSGSLYVSGSVIENESTDRKTIRKVLSTMIGAGSPPVQSIPLDTFSVTEFFSVRYYITGKPATRTDSFNTELLIAYSGDIGSTDVPTFAENRANVDYNKANASFSNYLSEDNLHFKMSQAAGVVTLGISGSYHYEQGAQPGQGMTLIINRVAYRF